MSKAKTDLINCERALAKCRFECVKLKEEANHYHTRLAEANSTIADLRLELKQAFKTIEAIDKPKH